jgi:hypothetical protein
MSQIQSKEDKGAAETINVLAWLSRTTLDVIGLAGKQPYDKEILKQLTALPGFSYKFNALAHGEDASELMKAFSKIFESGASFSIIPFLRGMFPALRWLVRPMVMCEHHLVLTSSLACRTRCRHEGSSCNDGSNWKRTAD